MGKNAVQPQTSLGALGFSGLGWLLSGRDSAAQTIAIEVEAPQWVKVRRLRQQLVHCAVCHLLRMSNY
jgi:mono/diheme cytochrome c family protein